MTIFFVAPMALFIMILLSLLIVTILITLHLHMILVMILRLKLSVLHIVFNAMEAMELSVMFAQIIIILILLTLNAIVSHFLIY